MLAPPTDATDPNLHVVRDTDPAVAELQLATAVDQLTKPEHVQLEREPGGVVDNMHADYRSARAKAMDQTRTDADRAAHHHRAKRLARDIVAASHRHTELPPLLTQLADAVQSTTSTGQPGNTTHPAPIGLAAAALLGDIEHHVGRTDDPVRAVQAWASQAGVWRSTNPLYLFKAAHLAQQWATAIRDLLNPERRYRPVRDTDCPQCERSHAWLHIDGERTRVPALLVDTETGTTVCRACGQHWPKEYGEWLGRVLAQQRADKRRRRQKG